jgi:hypothetical protein
LHRLVRHYLRQERPGQILQTTALVNEAWVRLINWPDVSWQNRAHFIGLAAQLMRRILVDEARRRQAQKYGASDNPIAERTRVSIFSSGSRLTARLAAKFLPLANS